MKYWIIELAIRHSSSTVKVRPIPHDSSESN